MDYLRGIAALSVVLFHYTKYLQIDHTPLGKLFSYGYLGVDLFFIISGYVIFYTLKNKPNPIAFIVARFTRLFPTYWTGVLLTTSVIILANNIGLDDEQITLEVLLWNMSMLQSFVNITDIDGAYWTLAIELIFYFVIGIIFYSFNKEGVIYTTLIIYLLISLAYKIDRINMPIDEAVASKFFIVHKIPWFIAGVSMYIMRNSRLIGYTIFFISLIIINIFTIKISSDHSLVILLQNTLIGATYISTQFLIPIKNSILKDALTFFGNISYPLYLIHGQIGWIVLVKICTFAPVVVCIAITVLITVSLSYIIHITIETKASNYLNRTLLGLTNKLKRVPNGSSSA